MRKKPASSKASSDLRQRAEQRLRARRSKEAAPPTKQNMGRLVHELQVHQIELEMQNEEMLAARTEAEAGRERYTDLYEFAPIGYLSMNEQGLILQANLAAAKLLGVERSRLIEQSLIRFICPEDRDTFSQYLGQRLEPNAPRECEVRVLMAGGAPSWVQVYAAAEPRADGTSMCRVVLNDINDRKQIEGAQMFLSQCGRQPSGEGFFRMLARYLAQSLEIDYVCIDRLLGDELTAETVAVYNDGRFEDDIKYALKDTPCGEVVDKTTCCFPRDVRHLFPKDAALQELKAESYVGTILWSYDGKPIGLIALIGRRPLASPRLAESVLKLVAVRAAGELERKQAEEAREAAHRQRLAILESIGDGFFSLDRQWQITYINERGARLLGKPRAELLGRNLWESFPQVEALPFRKTYERALAEQVSTNVEAFFPPLDAWFEARAYPSPEGLSVFFQNITERRNAQKVIESLARFPEEDPVSTLRILEGGTLAYANPASRALLTALGGGRSAQAPEALRGLALATLKSGQKQESDLTVAGRVFAITCTPFPDSGYVNIYGRDVTEERSAGRAILQAKIEWERTFDSVPDLIAILDKNHRIVRANRAMAARLGRTPDDCVGLICHQNMHGCDSPIETCPHVLTLTDGQEHSAEVYDESLNAYFLVTTNPIRDAEGQMVGAVHVARDITARRRAEEAGRQHMEELREVNTDLARFNRAAVGRELRMIELKKQVNELCAKAGLPPPYALEFEKEDGP